jgi:DNA-binding GntR family transcriptional regulator
MQNPTMIEPPIDDLMIPRRGLHDEVALRLREMLIEGQIEPGAKLNERELSLKLRVSRTPLREAIKLLGAEGLVDLIPNRGAVAVKLTENDILQVFEVLAGLEAMSGELAAQRISAAQFAEIKALHYEMLAAFARADLSGYYRLNARIHLSINEAAGNPLLMKTYKEINARVQSLRFRTNQNKTRWQEAVREHEAMLQALEMRDAAGMRRILTEHLLHKRDTVVELLRSGSVIHSVNDPIRSPSPA